VKKNCTTPWAEYDETDRVGLLSLVSDLIMHRRMLGNSPAPHFAIQCCKARKATDIRDRIYGLFGVLEELASSIGVDYQITPMGLWMSVLAYICREELEDQIIYRPPIDHVGEELAEALELEISHDTIREFIETQKAILD
jgi:hypothetical protein